MLKIKLPNLDGIAEHYHALYTEQTDGSFLLTGVEGMKSQGDIDKLTTALNAERTAHRATKQSYAPLAGTGMSVEDLVSLVDRRDELEALSSGAKDVDQLVQAKLKQVTAPLERELATVRTELAERDSALGEYKGKERQRTIHESIRAAALAQKGFRKEAVEDALLSGSQLFDVNEDGTVFNKDGLTPETWLSDLQAKRPHWWEASSGGGAGGAGGPGVGGDNPFSKASWNVTKQGELVRANPTKAAQMAQLAGVSIGATSPVK